jgi:hypothetical protein
VGPMSENEQEHQEPAPNFSGPVSVEQHRANYPELPTDPNTGLPIIPSRGGGTSPR